MRKLFVLLALLLLGACATTPAPLPSTFLIFFNANSAALTPEASSVIEQAVTAIKQRKPATVAIGAGAGAGSNLRLAGPRQAAVRQALQAAGVNPALLAPASLPNSGAEVRENGNQRVEIILGPPAAR
ncbi:MAG: hypothetical protein JO256_08955 [Alphaproteobacteria bacterium]|nr:hypothetical protein [Alphaproteobacteria bacterium]